ncbi:MAG: hypothetical protein HY548_03010, partial [Elusimicrobia bacterium]|nr:hypothetical protein [Elusimicrobiota bacterium]
MRKVLSILLSISLATPGLWAAAPDKLSYQGKLLENDGTPFTGDIAMTFRVCDRDEDCTNNPYELYEESKTVSVTNGVFSVPFGG